MVFRFAVLLILSLSVLLGLVSCSLESRSAGFFMYVSKNQGSSWKREFIEIKNATTDKVVDPSLLKLANGDILLYYLAANGDGDPASTQPVNTWRIAVARSTDDGRSFTQEKIIFSSSSTLSDPSPLALSNGNYIMYALNVTDNAIVSFSSVANDPTNFNSSFDSGNRADASGTPGAINISGTHYVYGCNEGGIIVYSASADGLTLTSPTTSLSSTTGYITCDASVAQSSSGNYVMVYKLSPNGAGTPETDVIFWADSTDGITFTKRGIIGYGSVPGFVIDDNNYWRVLVPNYEVE